MAACSTADGSSRLRVHREREQLRARLYRSTATTSSARMPMDAAVAIPSSIEIRLSGRFSRGIVCGEFVTDLPIFYVDETNGSSATNENQLPGDETCLIGNEV